MDGASFSYRIHFLIGATISAFLSFPIVRRVTDSVFSLRLSTKSRTEEVFLVVSFSMVVTSLEAATLGSWTWVCSESLWGKLCAILAGILGIAFLWGHSILLWFSRTL